MTDHEDTRIMRMRASCMLGAVLCKLVLPAEIVAAVKQASDDFKENAELCDTSIAPGHCRHFDPDEVCIGRHVHDDVVSHIRKLLSKTLICNAAVVAAGTFMHTMAVVASARIEDTARVDPMKQAHLRGPQKKRRIDEDYKTSTTETVLQD